ARWRMPTGACLAGWLLRLGHGPRLSPARASALREYKKGERPVADQDKPRPKAPTLVGVGPSSAPPVVGAVARPSAVGPSEVTRRMIFEPPSDADPRAGSRGGSPEEAGIDDQWPDEPPTAAPVQLATVPLALPVPTARQRKSSRALKALVAARSGSRRRRSR